MRYNVQAFIRCRGLGETGYNIHTIDLTIKGETALSLNKLYATIDDSARRKEGDQYLSIVKIVITRTEI